MTDQDFARLEAAREKKRRKLERWIREHPETRPILPVEEGEPIPTPIPYEKDQG